MKSFWIKERQNPQLGTYYTACGQMTKTVAKKCEQSIYGHNQMHRFDTEASYLTKLAELRAAGERVYAN